jgi:ParB family chromosome partitioning protein
MSKLLMHTVVGKDVKTEKDARARFWDAMSKGRTYKQAQDQIMIVPPVIQEQKGWEITYTYDEPATGPLVQSEEEVVAMPAPAALEPAPVFQNGRDFELIDKEQPVPVEDVLITKFNPRKHFDNDKIAALAADIEANGLINGITVRPKGKYKYELVAGERRLRAFRLLGRKTIPAKVRDLTDEQVLNIMLSENLHRVDLNAIEEANHLKRVLGIGNITQAALAERIGKSHNWVSERLRLADAPAVIQDMIVCRQTFITSAIEILGWQQSVLFDEIVKQIKAELVEGEELSRARVREIIKEVTEPGLPFEAEGVPEPVEADPEPVAAPDDACPDCVIGYDCPNPLKLDRAEVPEPDGLTDAERKLLELDPEPAAEPVTQPATPGSGPEVEVGERHRAASAYAKQVAEHEASVQPEEWKQAHERKDLSHPMISCNCRDSSWSSSGDEVHDVVRMAEHIFEKMRGGVSPKCHEKAAHKLAKAMYDSPQVMYCLEEMFSKEEL